MKISTSLLLAALATSPLSAQTLIQSDLVQGQIATLRVEGANPGDSIAFLLSYSGVGAGPCFPSVGLCLDILNPFSVIAVLPANGMGAAMLQGVVPPTVPLIPLYTQGAVIAANGSVTKTSPVSASFLPISHLGDDFETGTLDASWQVLHPEILNASVQGGALRLQPLVGGGPVTWFNNDEGPLVYKLITGDFSVSAVVRSFDPSNPSAPPPPSYRLAGVLVRDPGSTSGNHNFAHVAVGAATPAQPVVVEDKTTVMSTSDFLVYPIASTQGEVRVTRAGSTISLFYRPDAAATWQLLRSHQHPEFPATLQVGMMVYSNSVAPQIAATFDEIVFSN